MKWIEIKGDLALRRQLKRLSFKMQKKHVKHALRKAAKPMLLAARAQAPKDTSALAKSIYLRNMRRRDKNLLTIAVRVSESRMKKRGLKWYGHYQALGTKAIRAVEYMRSAFASEKSATIGRFQAALGRAIDLEARKR